MLLNSIVKGSSALERELDRFFGHPFFGGSSRRLTASTFAIDVAIGEKNVVVNAELPGVERKDLDVSLEDDVLTIKATRNAEKVEGEPSHIRRERHVGEFSRSVKLPVPVTEAKSSASYENGVLEVTLPRSEEARPRKIKIS